MTDSMMSTRIYSLQQGLFVTAKIDQNLIPKIFLEFGNYLSVSLFRTVFLCFDSLVRNFFFRNKKDTSTLKPKELLTEENKNLSLKYNYYVFSAYRISKVNRETRPYRDISDVFAFTSAQLQT